MTRKTVRNSMKPDRLTITLGPDQRSDLEAIAGDERTSIATVIRWALDEYIDVHRVDTTKRVKIAKRR